MSIEQDALAYHEKAPCGKLGIAPTKPCLTQHDLALAYTPGVAAPSRAIAADPEAAFRYTARGNLVAVVTNGTAVLGLGDIGPLAAKPVMEGKALLFKRFGDIDAIDIEVDTHDPDEFIHAVRLLEPSFGGINLEDIKAPECFYIEEQLQKLTSIPIFHDDQHGTAIIAGAALLNATDLVGKSLAEIRVVFSGAGAAAIATAFFVQRLGVPRDNCTFVDRAGVIYAGRTEHMNSLKERLAVETDARALAEALVGADVFIGLSSGGVVSEEMVHSMGPRPIIMAMANPDPEISFEAARRACPDAIIATGRSDYPNQVNNVLGFPFIFRGALDVRATTVNEEMKVAAAHSLAALAREEVPDSVALAYGLTSLRYGPDYIIPKPFDPRVLLWVAPAVAEAAMATGVARISVDLATYREQLENRLGPSREIMRIVVNKARSAPRRVLFTDGANEKVIRAAHQLAEEGIAHPILLGCRAAIESQASALAVPLSQVEIAAVDDPERREAYAQRLHSMRSRKGVTLGMARDLVRTPAYFGTMMVECGHADSMVTGVATNYPDALRPSLQIIKTLEDARIAAGVYLVATRQRVLFLADAAVNIEPDPETLASVAIRTARLALDFDVEPRVAMLSFSDFGSVRHPRTDAVRRAVELIRAREPGLLVDGEMQPTTALVEEILNGAFPFNTLRKEANVLIFPSLESGSIALLLLQRLAAVETIGPILVGMRKPVQVVTRNADVGDIVNLAAVSVVQVQQREILARADGWS